MTQWTWKVCAAMSMAVAMGTMDGAYAATVAFDENVVGTSSTDTLQEVLPVVNAAYAECEWMLSGMVDGGSSPSVALLGESSLRTECGTAMYMGAVPIVLTWDLGEAVDASSASEVKRLAVWLYARGPMRFVARWLVSNDGASFHPMAGTVVDHAFAACKSPATTMNRVAWTFASKEAVGAKYLRLELSGPTGQMCEIMEVDGEIAGVRPKKFTEIASRVSAVTANVPKAVADQTVEPAMQVKAVKFAGCKLVLAEKPATVMRLENVVAPNREGWTRTSLAMKDREIVGVMTRKDGLVRTCRAAIDEKNRVTIEMTLSVPASASAGLVVERDAWAFEEEGTTFDGVTYGSGSGPAFVGRTVRSSASIGERVPYLIFPSKKLGVEVQMYMPAWFDVMGRLAPFEDATLAKWEFFAGVKNFGVRDVHKEEVFTGGGRWESKPVTMKVGESKTWRMNVGVFAIGESSLGQKDIETTRQFGPISGIFVGAGNQDVPGSPRVVHRDRMLFMGFDVPAATRVRPGHHLQLEPQVDATVMADRWAKAGVGVMTWMSDYRDVSHGVSYQGQYDQAPAGFEAMLATMKSKGISVIGWFSPRGFLQVDWTETVKRDRLVAEHPDWFTKEAHWFGMYRSVNIFNAGASEWSRAKMASDLKRYPNLAGFAYDTFPAPALQIDRASGMTGEQIEMGWLKAFGEAIHAAGADKIVMSNGLLPMYDEYANYDFTVSEHPLLMFLNEVTGGRSPFGHPFVQWEKYGQLHFWYSVIGQMYYNFCDYDQALGWVGDYWVGMAPGQMRKNFDEEVAPIWKIIGQGRRIYGAQIAANVRQIEAKMPNGEVVVIVCSMADAVRDVTVVPVNADRQAKRVEVTIDTATQHSVMPSVDVGQTPVALKISQLPAYSIATIHFVKK